MAPIAEVFYYLYNKSILLVLSTPLNSYIRAMEVQFFGVFIAHFQHTIAKMSSEINVRNVFVRAFSLSLIYTCESEYTILHFPVRILRLL